MPALTLTKHHGWGNDFLVLLDVDDLHAGETEAMARALCARHTGIGADGLIRGSRGVGAADLTMELRNADGSRAEMSGNGIRCLAQAAADSGLLAEKQCVIATDGGERQLVVHPERAPGIRIVDVDMGPAEVGADMPQESTGYRARQVSIGNPHLVLCGPDPETVDVARLGREIQAVHAGGINVEFVMIGPGLDEVTMRVWERGVGETMACGTGACAAAAAAHAWELVGPVVTVHQRGGAARVELGPSVMLSGPSELIGRIELAGDGSWS
jgi:diaminopimelate epimerase